jgi:hypothetical protein
MTVSDQKSQRSKIKAVPKRRTTPVSLVFLLLLSTIGLPTGELAAGETVRGQVGFQVHQDASALLFVYDPDIWGFGKVFVTLP